jgi:hypothetical protein
MHTDLRAALTGAAAGIAATLVMSVPMVVAGRLGIVRRQAPQEITERALAHVDALDDTGDEARRGLTAVNHLGFGAAAGALYALAVRRLHPQVPGAAAGVAFGVALWTVSYVGWAPALGLMPRPDHDEPGRQPLMIAVHLLYGGVLGALVEAATDPERALAG